MALSQPSFASPRFVTFRVFPDSATPAGGVLAAEEALLGLQVTSAAQLAARSAWGTPPYPRRCRRLARR